MADPTPDDAPEEFWSDFGKFCASKLNLFDDFVKEKNTAPAPEANPADAPTDPPAKKKKGWFTDD